MKNKTSANKKGVSKDKALVVLSGVSRAKQDGVKGRCKMYEASIDLEQFTGSETCYRHWLNIHYTEGVKYLADNAKAHWLIDAIASYQTKKIVGVPFQIWELTINEDKTAVLTMKEDSDCPILVKQHIPYTDYPLPKIKLWLVDRVLMLPSEY
jgi:hypothetical protein